MHHLGIDLGSETHLFLPDLKTHHYLDTLGGNKPCLGNESSNRRKVRDLPFDDLIFPYHDTRNRNLPPLELSILPHVVSITLVFVAPPVRNDFLKERSFRPLHEAVAKQLER